MALTMKQEKFCNEYVKTGNAIESYLTAYDSNSRTAARIESSKLLQRDDITEYIQTLTKPLQNKAINEREKKRQILWSFIEDINIDNSDRLRAMDLLNKMDAEYININKNIDDHAPDIQNVDTTTLLRLVE